MPLSKPNLKPQSCKAQKSDSGLAPVSPKPSVKQTAVKCPTTRCPVTHDSSQATGGLSLIQVDLSISLTSLICKPQVFFLKGGKVCYMLAHISYLEKCVMLVCISYSVGFYEL